MKPISAAMKLLSVLALLAAAAASLTTLLWGGAFPAPAPAPPFNGALAEARGWSLVTLAVALPLLIAAMAAAGRGSLRAGLVWLGALAYLVYTYLELAVSPPFTALYLVYIAAFACALAALVAGVAAVDARALARALGERAPRRSVAAFALATAAFLSLAWLRGIVTRSAAGDFGWPQGEAAIGHVVHALDLGLQVPLALAAGLLLLRRRPSGFLAGAIFLVNAVCMGAALTAMVAASSLASGAGPLAAAPFAALPALAAVLTVAFLRALRPPAGEPGAGVLAAAA